MKTDILVIGGSAAGIAAANTAKWHYPDKKVAVVRKEKQVLIPCGIPYIFGTVGTPQKNLIPDGAVTNNGVELVLDEVTGLDLANKTAQGAGGEAYSYEKLILATGCLPLVPPIPGRDLENVFVCKKDVDYLSNIQTKLKETKNVVIIGGGFIGVEFADEFKKSGCNVTIVEMLPHVLYTVLAADACMKVEEALKESGVVVKTGAKVQSLEGNQKVEKVVLADGEELPADMVILAIGVKPNAELAKNAGLQLGRFGAIAVDSMMRTSQADVFAAGDCTEKVDFLTGKPSPLRLASIATVEARIAGANAYEIRRESKGTVGVFSTKVGNVCVGVAGYSEQRVQSEGIAYVMGTIDTINRHPGCMPGAAQAKTSLIFKKKTGELIGGQVCCGESVGELVNVIAALIQSRTRIDDAVLFQMGTQPCLTPSPLVYTIVAAAENALKQL